MNIDDYNAHINQTMRNVFGSGDLDQHVTEVTDDIVWTHQRREPRLAFEVEPRRIKVRRPPPPPRVLPRFREVMEDPGPPPGAPHPAVAAAKTWLHGATHQPSEQTKDALLDHAVEIVRGLLDEG